MATKLSHVAAQSPNVWKYQNYSNLCLVFQTSEPPSEISVSCKCPLLKNEWMQPCNVCDGITMFAHCAAEDEWNYLENMSVLWMPSLEVLAHIRITTGCLFTEIWLKSAVVAALDVKWITSYSATLLPDSRRLPAGNIGQIEKLMPCATLPRIYMVQQRGTMSSSKNQNASSWSDSSILLMRNLFWMTRDVQL